MSSPISAWAELGPAQPQLVFYLSYYSSAQLESNVVNHDLGFSVSTHTKRIKTFMTGPKSNDYNNKKKDRIKLLCQHIFPPHFSGSMGWNPPQFVDIKPAEQKVNCSIAYSLQKGGGEEGGRKTPSASYWLNCSHINPATALPMVCKFKFVRYGWSNFQIAKSWDRSDISPKSEICLAID